MFGRWVNTRLKVAEKALRLGRIDDAYAALSAADLRKDARGQELAAELVAPMLARARLHRQAGRYSDALADLDRLATLGQDTLDVQTLRRQVEREMQLGAAQAAQAQVAYDQAVNQLRAGNLDAGRAQVERVADTMKREQLQAELAQRQERGAELLDQAAAALDRNDVLLAARHWQDATTRHGRTTASDQLATRVAAALRDAVQRWHADGRLETLLAVEPHIAVLVSHDATLTDVQRLAELNRRAATELARRDYAALRQTLLRLKAARGDVAWVNAALAAVAGIGDGEETLLASPLGLLVSLPGNSGGRTNDRRGPVGAAPARLVKADLDARSIYGDAVRLDRPLLMLVDGGGSSLILHREQVRIGRAGTSAPIDVALPAELESHHADIVRRGSDYFLHAYGPARVNDLSVRQVRLRDGDRVTLGDGGRFTFSLPSARSESAVLRLSHRCRMAQDVSDVVLLVDTCLVGAGSAVHVRTNEDGQLVLFEHAGGLCARPTGGQAFLTAPPVPVIAGQTLEFGNLRVTVKVYG